MDLLNAALKQLQTLTTIILEEFILNT